MEAADPLNATMGNRLKLGPYQLESGATYTGEWLNRMRDGQGE